MSYLWLMIYSVLSDWLTDWLTAWLTDWLNDRPTGWPTGQLADRLTDWQTDWLTDWPTDWLTVTVNLYCALLSKRGYRSVYNKGRLQCRLLIDCWVTNTGSLIFYTTPYIPGNFITTPCYSVKKMVMLFFSRVPNRFLSYRHLFPQSRNPEGYFWHPVSLALIFNPESRPSNEANLETRRTYWGL